MPTPPINSLFPRVKRGCPAGLPSPTQATSNPRKSVNNPFNGRSDVMKTAQVSPSSTSQKYSNELKRIANSANAGAATISTAVPNRPPTAEKTSPAPRASSACPLRVIAKASSVYAAEAGVPGIRSRQPGMSPEKIAIAVAVTIAAIAGIGGMKNVTGTSSAVAIVAVSPGTAPTNRPKSEASTITRMVYGSKTVENAWTRAAHIG